MLKVTNAPEAMPAPLVAALRQRIVAPGAPSRKRMIKHRVEINRPHYSGRSAEMPADGPAADFPGGRIDVDARDASDR